jgi:hypothetical protein
MDSLASHARDLLNHVAPRELATEGLGRLRLDARRPKDRNPMGLLKRKPTH